jgi:hypothetical protein
LNIGTRRIAALAATTMALAFATAPTRATEPPVTSAKAASAPDKAATEQAEFLEFLGSTGAEDEAFMDFLSRTAGERSVANEAPKQAVPPKTASRGESNER